MRSLVVKADFKAQAKHTRHTDRAAKEVLSAQGKRLMEDIETHLHQVEFFTRDDLLQLPTFSHVATITRYHYLRAVVSYLIDKGKILEHNRRDLYVQGMTRVSEVPLHERYADTIDRLVARTGGVFGVMDVVALWKTDPHLTVDAKRAAVRVALRRALSAGKVTKAGPFSYALVKGAA